MKALIRNEGETITEGMGIPCIDWDTGAPLTNAKWFGGPYILVNDYVPDAMQAPPAQEPAAAPVTEDTVQDTIVIDGVTYTRTS